MFLFLESGHYFGTVKKGIVDKQFETEGVIISMNPTYARSREI